MSDVKHFTIQEVSSHNSRADLWTVLHKKVYDITKFIDEHPGGEEVLLESAGADATEGFEDIGHSDDARKLLLKYYLGDLKGDSVLPKPKDSSPPKPTAAKPAQESKPFFYVIPVIALVAAFFSYKHFGGA